MEEMSNQTMLHQEDTKRLAVAGHDYGTYSDNHRAMAASGDYAAAAPYRSLETDGRSTYDDTRQDVHVRVTAGSPNSGASATAAATKKEKTELDAWLTLVSTLTSVRWYFGNFPSLHCCINDVEMIRLQL